jgi:hypothetical protein
MFFTTRYMFRRGRAIILLYINIKPRKEGKIGLAVDLVVGAGSTLHINNFTHLTPGI